MKSYGILFIFSFFTSIFIAQSQKIEFISKGETISGYMYQAPNETKKPTLIWLYGNPGIKETGDSQFARDLNNLGINVLRFNYRGTWGTKGLFNLTNSLEDLSMAMDFVTSDVNIEKFNIDINNISVGGISWATTVSLVGAIYDERIHNVICLATCDHSYFGKEFMNPESEIRDFLEPAMEDLFLPNGLMPQDRSVFIDDLVNHIYAYDFVKHANKLLDDRLLFFTALDDEVCRIEHHFMPLYNELKRINHNNFEVYVEKCNHDFDCEFSKQIPAIISNWIKKN